MIRTIKKIFAALVKLSPITIEIERENYVLLR